MEGKETFLNDQFDENLQKRADLRTKKARQPNQNNLGRHIFSSLSFSLFDKFCHVFLLLQLKILRILPSPRRMATRKAIARNEETVRCVCRWGGEGNDKADVEEDTNEQNQNHHDMRSFFLSFVLLCFIPFSYSVTKMPKGRLKAFSAFSV